MRKKKKQPRELTQFQQDMAEYRAYSHQAYLRKWMMEIGAVLPWEDPTVEPSEDE